MEDISNVNLYELLEISAAAEEADIRKAYRKKALSCHPDKNPDNPNAVKLFQQLTKALEILLDDVARAAYDKTLKAKEAVKVRNRELNDERKRFKEELEVREYLHRQEYERSSAQDRLKKEIERLRREGAKRAEEEAERVRQMILKQMQENYDSNRRIKVSWKAEKGDPKNGGYNESNLRQIFSQYGKLEELIISTKKNGSALIEFDTPESAKLAKLLVTGLSPNPLKLKILGAADEKVKKEQVQSMINTEKRNPNNPNSSNLFPCFTAAQNTVFSPETSKSSFDDFETEVLERLSRAQERKDLLEKLERENRKC